MPIIVGRDNVIAIYQEAAAKHWVLPCFCSENLTTTEAILAAAKKFGEEKNIEDLPIIIAITCRYSPRMQASYYTHTRRWDVGLKLFLADIQVLTEKNSPFDKLRVLIHLDHIQFDDDRELLSWNLGSFSSIMYDASKLPFEENLALTARFVKERGGEIVVEGACDEIMDAAGEERSDLTTPEHAERYMLGTGADMIVANLGTEHRASAEDLCYHGEQARRIRERIGNRIVLHGASSVPGDQLADLFKDGVCKVNIWTALERDSSPDLLTVMVEHSCEVAGPAAVSSLKSRGLLGENCTIDGKASLDYCTTVSRQDIVFGRMKCIVYAYLRLWYS